MKKTIVMAVVMSLVMLFATDAFACAGYGEYCSWTTWCCGDFDCQNNECVCPDSDAPNPCGNKCYGCTNDGVFVCKNGTPTCKCPSYAPNQCGDYCYDDCDADEEFGCEGDQGMCYSSYDDCADTKCYNGDVYCYDSNGDKADKYDECGSDSSYCTAAKCDGNKVVYDDVTELAGCELDTCYTATMKDTVVVETCACGCSQGKCVACGVDDCLMVGCYGGDLYCYDSNNVKQAKKEECGTTSTDAGTNYCVGKDIYYDNVTTERGCASNDCYEKQKSAVPVFVKTCATSCSGGQCVGAGCVNECPLSGVKDCKDAATIETCGNYDWDPCLEWGNFQGCNCVGGACVTPCNDQCTVTDFLNSPDCQNGVSVKCSFDAKGCLIETQQSCADGCNVLTGACNPKPICSNKCSPSGKTKCIDSGHLQVCKDYNGDGCYEWGGEKSCNCVNDACVVCNNQCSVVDMMVSPYCDGDKLTTCKANANGCLVKEGQSCVYGCNDLANICMPKPCESACAFTGQQHCLDSFTIETCGNFNADNCFEWGNPQGCNCVNDHCCANACTLGAVGCSADLSQKYQCVTVNDCPTKSFVNCSANEKCVNGVCEKKCSDACSPAQVGCLSDSQKWTCVLNSSTKCYEKKASACTNAQACQNGICVCQENWQCGEWGNCVGGVKKRQCEDLNDCGTIDEIPVMVFACQLNCQIYSVYFEPWITVIPGKITDGTPVDVVIETSPDCVGASFDLTITESDVFWSDDVFSGTDEIVGTKTAFTWYAEYWGDEFQENALDFILLSLEELEAEVFATVYISEFSIMKKTGSVPLLPSVVQMTGILELVKKYPLENVPECTSADIASEKCAELFLKIGVLAKQDVQEVIEDNIMVLGSIAACKGMEMGGAYACVTLGFETAGIACMIGLPVAALGFLCDIFYLPDWSMAVDVFTLNAVGFTEASFKLLAKSVRMSKILGKVSRAVDDEVKAGWKFVDKEVDEFGGYVKLEKNGVKKRVNVYFKQGVSESEKLLAKEYVSIFDYAGGADCFDWMVGYGVKFKNYEKATPDMLKKAAAWFDGGAWVESYDDAISIVQKHGLVSNVKELELVDKAYFDAAKVGDVLQMNAGQIADISAKLPANKYVTDLLLKHEIMHDALAGSFYKAGYEVHPVSQIGVEVVNPALEFVTDSIYLKHGKNAASFLAANHEEVSLRYSQHAYAWSLSFIEADKTWLYPEGLELVRVYAYALKTGDTTWQELIKKNLKKFAPNVNPAKILELETMAQGLVDDAAYIVDNLPDIAAGKGTVGTEQAKQLASEKYKMFVFKTSNFSSVRQGAGVAAYAVSGVDKATVPVGVNCYGLEDCPAVDCPEEGCDDEVESHVVAPSLFSVIPFGCSVTIRWFIFYAEPDLIQDCEFDFVGNLVPCKIERISDTAVQLSADYQFDYDANYSVTASFTYWTTKQFFQNGGTAEIVGCGDPGSSGYVSHYESYDGGCAMSQAAESKTGIALILILIVLCGVHRATRRKRG